MQVAEPLFTKLRTCQKKYIVLQGGGDAAKTITNLQVNALRSIEFKGYHTTITAQDMPNLKGGAFNAFEKYVLSYNDISRYVKFLNKSDHTIYWYNKSKTQFKAFESVQDAAGSERDELFANEANALQYKLFWQLARKTRKRIVIDYNPTSRFWAHEKILPGPAQEGMFRDKVQFYRVWHQHNPFLSQEEHDNYENITDPELFRVYSRGLTGKITGLIFGHFREVLPSEWPLVVDRIIYGIDFGYTSDPTAIVKIAVVGRKRYVKLLHYETGSNAEAINAILRNNGWEEGQDLYSDTDPNMVNQLRALRLPVVPWIKGPGSIAAGISKVRQFECFYTADSDKLREELGQYKFVTAQDIVTGNEVITNVPMSGWDHACDALRGSIYTDTFKHRIS
jgi:phage terminase large subunit